MTCQICLRVVGLAGSPADAIDDVRSLCDFVSSNKGGDGAVREFCDHIARMHRRLNACICIPARLDSTRLPGKLLLKIDNISVIRRTCLQCKLTNLPVYVFTDSEEIDEVKDIAVVLSTPGKYENGSERLSKNLHQLPPLLDTIINVQGDEPFVSPENILRVVSSQQTLSKYILHDAA